jgi:hypothetical protein
MKAELLRIPELIKDSKMPWNRRFIECYSYCHLIAEELGVRNKKTGKISWGLAEVYAATGGAELVEHQAKPDVMRMMHIYRYVQDRIAAGKKFNTEILPTLTAAGLEDPAKLKTFLETPPEVAITPAPMSVSDQVLSWDTFTPERCIHLLGGLGMAPKIDGDYVVAAQCPNHVDQHRSVSIDLKNNSAKCFSCGTVFSLIDYLHKVIFG